MKPEAEEVGQAISELSRELSTNEIALFSIVFSTEFGQKNLACTKRRNVETKRPKRNGRNHRNDRNETTETKRPKRNDRNETTETKRPKRNDRNEMTETKRPKRNSRKYKLQEKWKTLKLMKFTGIFIEILRQLGCGSTGL